MILQLRATDYMLLKKLQEVCCPNSQCDEDIESLNERKTHAKRK
jgi:hypothetical protein